MPKYRATQRCYVGEILRQKGDVFESNAKIPGKTWVLLNDDGTDAAPGGGGVATAEQPKAKLKKGRREAPPGSTAAFLGDDVAAGPGED